MALMYIWLKRAYISSFLCRSLAPTTRFSLFHRPELTAPIIRQMCQGTEKSAMILSVKLCSKNSCIAILSKCWRWPSTEYLTVCIIRDFLGTVLLNEADNPPSWLSRLWHVLGWFFLRFELVILLHSTFVPVKEVCYYSIQPVYHLRPQSKSYCPIFMCSQNCRSGTFLSRIFKVSCVHCFLSIRVLYDMIMNFIHWGKLIGMALVSMNFDFVDLQFYEVAFWFWLSMMKHHCQCNMKSHTL